MTTPRIHAESLTYRHRQDRYVENCYSVDAELRAEPYDLSLARIESKTASIKPVTDVCHTI